MIPKGLGKVAPEKLMLSKLTAIIGDAEHSIDLLSAYFIPGDAGTDILTAAAQSGVRVRTLTNSLEATDVLPVHAGYTKYRAPCWMLALRFTKCAKPRSGEPRRVGLSWQFGRQSARQDLRAGR